MGTMQVHSADSLSLSRSSPQVTLMDADDNQVKCQSTSSLTMVLLGADSTSSACNPSGTITINFTPRIAGSLGGRMSLWATVAGGE